MDSSGNQSNQVKKTRKRDKLKVLLGIRNTGETSQYKGTKAVTKPATTGPPRIPNHRDRLVTTFLGACLSLHWEREQQLMRNAAYAPVPSLPWSRGGTSGDAVQAPASSVTIKQFLDKFSTTHLSKSKDTHNREIWREDILWPFIRDNLPQCKTFCEYFRSFFTDKDNRNKQLLLTQQRLSYTVYKDIEATGDIFWTQVIKGLEDERIFLDVIIECVSCTVRRYTSTCFFSHSDLANEKQAPEVFITWFHKLQHRNITVDWEIIDDCLRSCDWFRELVIDEAKWKTLDLSFFPNDNREWLQQAHGTLLYHELLFNSFLAAFSVLNDEYREASKSKMMEMLHTIKKHRVDIVERLKMEAEGLNGLAQFFYWLDIHYLGEELETNNLSRSVHGPIKQISEQDSGKLHSAISRGLLSDVRMIFRIDNAANGHRKEIAKLKSCLDSMNSIDDPKNKQVQSETQSENRPSKPSLSDFGKNWGFTFDKLWEHRTARIKYYLDFEASPGQLLASYFHYTIDEGISQLVSKSRRGQESPKHIDAWTIIHNRRIRERQVMELEVQDWEEKYKMPRTVEQQKVLLRLKLKLVEKQVESCNELRDTGTNPELYSDYLQVAGIDNDLSEICTVLLPLIGHIRVHADSSLTLQQFVGYQILTRLA